MDMRVRAVSTQHNYLEGTKEGEQGRVVFPVLVDRMYCAEGVGVSEHLGLALQVDFSVDVGGVDGNVSEPCADGIDINS